MTAKIKRGSQYAEYIWGEDNSLALSDIAGETVESEIILNDSAQQLGFPVGPNGGIGLLVPQGLNFAFNVIFYASKSGFVEVLLDNSLTGEYKRFFFGVEVGSNRIVLFEPTLQPDTAGFIYSTNDTNESFCSMTGFCASDSYLGA